MYLQYGEDPNFPPRVLEAANRYKYDETLKSDKIEYQRIYEELKVEAALVVIVSELFLVLTGLFVTFLG